jgi:subtilisin family serine protease
VAVPPQAEWAVAEALSKNPLIAFAEPDMRVEPSEFIPDDPQFPNEWHLQTIHAPAAWDISTGNGITVAILDTGIDHDHPELVSRLVPGWNAVSLNDETSPVNGHGTQVAGVVAAETNNAIGVASIAYGAHLMPIRVTNRSDAAPVTVTADNAPPTVAIITPVDGASVRGRVTLSAHATDDAGVASVTIAVDGQTTCAGDGTTVSCDWQTGNLRGYHTITAAGAVIRRCAQCRGGRRPQAHAIPRPPKCGRVPVYGIWL